MHNCKATREHVTEFLLDRPDSQPDEVLAGELGDCAECHQEFDSVKQTLRVSRRLIETVAPSETYWEGYHTKLKQKLTSLGAMEVPSSRTSWLMRFCMYSIRVPVPVGIASLLVFALSLFFALRASQKVPPAHEVSIVHVPVEVPVVQEKVVTRVVYRKASRQTASRSSDGRGGDKAPSNLARAKKPEIEANPMSLVGFKPLDEVKLTVIKGGSPDEK
jgi:hypothetical protein